MVLWEPWKGINMAKTRVRELQGEGEMKKEQEEEFGRKGYAVERIYLLASWHQMNSSHPNHTCFRADLTTTTPS